jgi:transposase-like protein
LDTLFIREEKIEMVSRRSFSREFKLGICREIVSGVLTKSQACREHGFSPGMLDRWVDQFKVLGTEAFPNSGSSSASKDFDRMKELEALVGRLTLENEFLKAAVKMGLELREKKSQ